MKSFKIWNLIVQSLLIAGMGSFGFSVLMESLFGKSPFAIFLSIMFAVILGVNSRKIVESANGYTLQEAINDQKD